MSLFKRLRDAAGVLSSMVSATSTTGAQALVAAALQAGSTLDVLKQLKQQEQLLVEQLLAHSRHEHMGAAHGHVQSNQHGAPTTAHPSTSTSHASSASGSMDPPLLAALRASRQHVPAPLLNRMTRFAVEEGLEHLIRGLSRGIPSVVGSSAPSHNSDPFGLLMALPAQHALRPLTFHEYLSACTTLSQHGGELLHHRRSLRVVHTYCRMRRALLKSWESWPPAGLAADPQVASHVSDHIHASSSQLQQDEAQLTALATWHDSHMRMLRRDTLRLDMELLELQLSNKLGSAWGPGSPVFAAWQQAKPLWSQLVERVHVGIEQGQGETKQQEDLDTDDSMAAGGDGQNQAGPASNRDATTATDDSTPLRNLMHLSLQEWAVLERSLHAVAAALHPARTVEASVSMQLREDLEEAAARLAACQHGSLGMRAAANSAE